MKAGLSPQREVVRDQERRGRVAMRVRQGVGECVDVVSFARRTNWCAVEFIRCKDGGRCSARERAALVERAAAAGAIPTLAYRGPDGSILYERADLAARSKKGAGH